MRRVLAKLPLNFKGLHGVISQKRDLLTITALGNEVLEFSITFVRDIDSDYPLLSGLRDYIYQSNKYILIRN
jgi:hypothetical protein